VPAAALAGLCAKVPVGTTSPPVDACALTIPPEVAIVTLPVLVILDVTMFATEMLFAVVLIEALPVPPFNINGIFSP
jgi:hypothetical protein